MRKLFYILICVLCTGFLDSCHPSESTTESEDSTALRLGVLPTLDCLPFYYADSVGLYDSLGLSVRLVTFDAAMDADTAFRNGQIDGIVTDLVKATIWKCDSVQIVMNGDLRLWLVTALNARLLKAESLKEKIIGITRHSSLDFFADQILSSASLQSIDLNKPQINNIKLRTLMVDQNQYDGALLPEPYASEAVARGAKRLASTADLKLANMMCVVFPDSTVKAREDEVKAIQQVYDLAVRKLNADSTLTLLDFFPAEHRLDLPDTLFTPAPFSSSTQPSDSLKRKIELWAKGRGLIK